MKHIKPIKQNHVHVSGKRKRAVARATLKPGKGIVKINHVPLEIFGNELSRLRVKEPIMTRWCPIHSHGDGLLFVRLVKKFPSVH